MALTDFLKKKYQELTAPRLSQPRPNASQVVQNAIVNSIPIVGQVNAFMGRNNGGVNPNLNIPQVYRSGARAVEQGVNFVQPIANKAASYYFNGLHPANQNNFLYRNAIKPFVVDSLLNAPLNAVKANSQFIQNPSVKGAANMIGQNVQTGLNFFTPTSVSLKAGQKVLPQIPRLLSNSAVKVGLPAGVSTGMITYGQGGSKEDIMRNSYEAFLAGTGFGVGFPVAGRLGSNTLSGIKNKFIPKPQTSFLDSGIGGKGSPVTSTTRNALEKPLAVEPFKDEGNLSTTTLSKLEGKTTVKKQFIQDLTNAPDLKQNERELIRTVLDDYGDTVDVKDFAKKVKAELLPLEVKSQLDAGRQSVARMSDAQRYENITLPRDLRGNVANYKENIYESPIQTSAGNVHFPGATDKYFGHTRIEDMATEARMPVRQMDGTWAIIGSNSGKKLFNNSDDAYAYLMKDKENLSTVRRVIEIQSDLYQRGNLGKEGYSVNDLRNNSVLEKYIASLPPAKKREIPTWIGGVEEWLQENDPTFLKKIMDDKNAPFAKLQQYNDPTAHFRMIREEVKKAAEDGKTKLQFPTGETAMEIEGLGAENPWRIATTDSRGEPNFATLLPEDIQNGQIVHHDVGNAARNSWVITDVLGDGKFKAITKNELMQSFNNSPSRYKSVEEALKTRMKNDKEYINRISEEFDISGKVDQNNPIYKFYEKEVGKYLKNKYNAELVTDAQGVTWWEVDLKGKGFESKPVTAFLETKKPSDPLTQEARKYKSAEEFVKAQGTPLYHGTSAKEFGDFKGDTYLTADPREAMGFAEGVHLGGGTGGNPRNIEVYGKFNKVKNLDEGIVDALDTGNVDEWITEQIKIAKKDGYDAVTFTHPSNYTEGEFTAYVPTDNSLIQTKSQLTDIWNKANKPTVQEAKNPVIYKSTTGNVTKEYRFKDFADNDGYVYHATSPNNIDGIRELGLKVSNKGYQGKGVYFAPDEASTTGQASYDGAVVRVNVSKLDHNQITSADVNGFGDPTELVYGKTIPASAVEIKTKNGWQPLNQSSVAPKPTVQPKTEQSFLEIKKPITINPLKSDAEKVGISESSLRRALPNLSRKPPATPQPPDKVVFREELNRVLGRQQSGELRAVQEAIPFTKVDSKEAEAIIDAIQDPKANIPTYAKYGDYIKNIRSKFDELFKEAEDTGMDIGYRENYLPQIWKETETEIAEKMASVRGGFKFKKERTIPTYAEGKSMGLTPKYTHPAELVEAWVRNFERAKANFEFSQRLQQRGIIVPGDLVSPALPNYRAITAGGFPTSQNNIPFYAPKEIADAINTAFEIKESPRLLDITAKISSKAQDIGLSGGIPRTPINAFSVAQVIKEVTSGRIVSPVTSAFRATFGDFRKYVGKNADVIREIQEAGTPLRLNTSIRNFLDQSTGERIFGRSFNEAWNKNISEATFGKFMPMLQVEFYKDVKAQALKSGIGNDEAVKVANKALRNFYGLADIATDATRSKVTSDIWTTLVFAPRYRESMIRFWVNNAKAMKNPTALENRQNVKFVIGAVISAVAYDLLNRQFNDGRGILDNPPGKEDKLLIPLDDGRTIGVPFLSSIATLPRTAFKIGKNVVTGDFKQAGLETKALGSFAYKPLLDIIQNEDYFGNKVVADDSKNAVRDRFAYLTKAYAHPYMRELINAYGPDWLSTKSQRDVPTSQRFMQAFELPIRFYTTSGIKGSYYYKAKDDSLKKLSTKERELYDKLNAPSEVDDAGLPVYNIRSEMSNALDRLSNPKITAVETKIALDTARNTGEKPNPFYLLSPKQQETVLMLKTFYPGDKTKSEITNANKSWLEPYWKARDEFIGGLKAKGVIKENPSFNQRPQATPQLQSKLDYYNTLPSGTGARSSFIRSNADVEQFFNDSRNYTNSQRADLGLPLLAGYSGSSGGKKPKKLKAIKIKLPKIKTAKFKKPKKPKKLKAYSLKKIKSKKIKLRASLT